MDFTNKTAIVSVQPPVWALFSRNFASLGGNVVMTDVNKSALDKYVDEINSAGTERKLVFIVMSGLQ